MNSTIKDLPQILDFMLDHMSPSHNTLVGAGNGKGRWAQWLSTLKLPSTLVEADEQQFAALQRVQAAGSLADARLLHAVVAAEAGEIEFYTSSLAAESGLLPAEAVQQLWPNVYTLQAHQRHAIGLAELLAQQHTSQWLVLDCLPSASFLKAAASALLQLDVVVARVLLTENKAYQIHSAGLAELKGSLPAFTQLALQPTRHPDIAYALFVRDYRHATTQALKAQMEEQENKQAVIQFQKVLQAQLEQEQHRNTDLLQKYELQAQSRHALEADLAKVTLAYATECQARQAAEHAQDALQAQLKQAEQFNTDLLKKLELQAQAQQALEANLANKVQACDAEVQANKALQAQLEELKAEQQETQQRQALLDDELNRAEVQLQLLEALLFPDAMNGPSDDISPRTV